MLTLDNSFSHKDSQIARRSARSLHQGEVLWIDDMKQTLNLYSYVDYRAYLRDYYDALKVSSPQRASYRYISRRAGFTSSNFLYLVIHGKRNLGYGSIQRLAKALTLTKRETLFLENLVHFNQTEDPDEKDRAFRKMLTFKEYRQAAAITPAQYDLFAKWYYVVIREMVNLAHFRADPHWIAQHTQPPITAAEAQEALERLFALELLAKDEDGNVYQVDHHIQTGDKLRLVALKAFHNAMIGHGQQALRLPSERREVSGLTVSITQQQYDQICRRLQEFHHEIQEVVAREHDHPAEHIYQLNLQFFPLTSTSEDTTGENR
jgi:uncharacterized protein (TIGR02147 family)